MGLHHELGVQADEDLGVVHGLPAGVIDGVHDDLVQGGGVHAGLSGDPAGGGVAAGDGTVVEQQDLGVGLQAELLAPVDGHVGDHGAGRVLGHVIGLPEGVDLHDVVAVEGGLNDGAGLGEPDLAGSDLGSGVIGFRRHICSSFKMSKCLRLVKSRAAGITSLLYPVFPQKARVKTDSVKKTAGPAEPRRVSLDTGRPEWYIRNRPAVCMRGGRPCGTEQVPGGDGAEDPGHGGAAVY